jgi:nitrous oxide reductase
MNKIKFTQHIPNFANGYPPTKPLKIEATWEEILKHEFFNNSIKENLRFHGQTGDSHGKLMVQNENNTKWYVIGFLSQNPNLPLWTPPKQKNEHNGKSIKLSQEEKKAIEDRFNSKINKSK